VASRDAARNRSPGRRGAPPAGQYDPAARSSLYGLRRIISQTEARPPAKNRHGGAPRGARPASWDARRCAPGLPGRVFKCASRVNPTCGRERAQWCCREHDRVRGNSWRSDPLTHQNSRQHRAALSRKGRGHKRRLRAYGDVVSAPCVPRPRSGGLRRKAPNSPHGLRLSCCCETPGYPDRGSSCAGCCG
jgi:hypothetical protein